MIPGLISIVALIISAFSFFISSERFRLDLYNKRFGIYMRTVKFHQALDGITLPRAYINDVTRLQNEEHQAFARLQSDFILAVRESKFLFSPESGVHMLLSRLNSASFEISDLKPIETGSPVEDAIRFHRQIADARELWKLSIESLEDMMAPYLNYHYNSAFAALFGVPRLWKRKARPR